MPLKIHWQSVKFNEADIVRQYVRFYSNGEVIIYDVDVKHKTIRERTGTVKDIPSEWARQNPNSFDMVQVSGPKWEGLRR